MPDPFRVPRLDRGDLGGAHHGGGREPGRGQVGDGDVTWPVWGNGTFTTSRTSKSGIGLGVGWAVPLGEGSEWIVGRRVRAGARQHDPTRLDDVGDLVALAQAPRRLHGLRDGRPRLAGEFTGDHNTTVRIPLTVGKDLESRGLGLRPSGSRAAPWPCLPGHIGGVMPFSPMRTFAAVGWSAGPVATTKACAPSVSRARVAGSTRTTGAVGGRRIFAVPGPVLGSL